MMAKHIKCLNEVKAEKEKRKKGSEKRENKRKIKKKSKKKERREKRSGIEIDRKNRKEEGIYFSRPFTNGPFL